MFVSGADDLAVHPRSGQLQVLVAGMQSVVTAETGKWQRCVHGSGHRVSERDDAAETAQQRQIVLQALAETETGIDQDRRRCDSRLQAAVDAVLQKRRDLGDNVGICRCLLHAARFAKHV